MGTETTARFNRIELEQRRRLLAGSESDPDESPWLRCTGDDVAGRNRYINVEPYRANRVRLQVPEGQNDYINASPIVLESTKSKTVTKFIATQGPRFDTTAHFWRMAWNETPSPPGVIIMLTQTHESNREKCHQYYPKSFSQPTTKLNFDDEYQDNFIHTLRLSGLQENEATRAQIRELDMETATPEADEPMTEEQDDAAPQDKAPPQAHETKKFWHLLFEGWPDFSVPERDALINLIHLSREKNGNSSLLPNRNSSTSAPPPQTDPSPRIIHCSAGVGRTGTFIALDHLLTELNEGSLDAVPDDQDPVLSVVEALRAQRMMMVQAESQFAFIYDVLRDAWRERWIRMNPVEAERLGLQASTQGLEERKGRVMEGLEGEGMDGARKARKLGAGSEGIGAVGA